MNTIDAYLTIILQGVEDMADVISEVESVRVINASKCATWSDNPEKSDWVVRLLLSSERPQDLSSRIGFVVVSNLDSKQPSEENNKTNKMHSRHDTIDLPAFCELLDRGSYFTKLELDGGFFNNSYLFPHDLSPDDADKINLITLPNLKTLSIKAKLALTLKGLDADTQHQYYCLHREHCNSFKTRTAKNLWYVFKAFECPKLSTLEVMDCMEWDDPELKNSDFFYWDQPLVSFLQRHAATLRSFKTSPIVVMQLNKSSGHVDFAEVAPSIEDVLFWMKLHLDDLSSSTSGAEQRELKLHIEIEKLLRPWRQFLQAQKSLKTLIWITDAQNPWTFTRRDFGKLCLWNLGMESIMLALHGDQQFRDFHNLPQQQHPVNNVKDYEIDATLMHGMTSLRILSLGCYGKDPQMKNFCFSNLHLLPPTLDTVQLFGIRVMSTDLESLAKLPLLRSLTLVQGGKTTYTEQDELNGNIEGVTGNVLKTLITSARTLDKLVIVGFPISSTKCGDLSTVKTTRKVANQNHGWFGYVD